MKDGKDYLIEEKVLGNIYFYDESKSNISISEGNIIRFQGRIKLPKEKRNPGGFDYSTYLKTKNVYSTLSIGEESVEVLGKKSLGMVRDNAFNIKANIIKVIEENLSKDHGDLLKGIIFGEKDLDNSIRIIL